MSDKIFVDTNLWVYLYADDSDKEKTKTVSSLVDKYFENITISTQVLGEFFHVLTKKGLKEKEEARQMGLDISSSCNNLVALSIGDLIKILSISPLVQFHKL
jgi:predicted nucleic acid-binding protein